MVAAFALQIGPEVGYWANVVKGYMLAIGVAFTIYLAVRWWQYKVGNDRADRAARAKHVYSVYLQRAMDMPDIARPTGPDAAKITQRPQYPWFVGFLLTSAEEILLLDATPQWRETIARQLGPHREFLASQAFRDGPYRTLSEELRGLVDDAIVHTETHHAPVVPGPPSGGADVRSIHTARR